MILDFGFWAREEREAYRPRHAAWARSKVQFLDVPDGELLRRLVRRNAQLSPLAVPSSEELLPPGQVHRASLAFHISEAMMQPC